MLVSFNPMVSNNKSKIQNQKFGSFPVPRDSFDARRLYEKAYGGDLLPTPDNIESLKKALKEGKKTTQMGLEELAELWKLNPTELRK